MRLWKLSVISLVICGAALCCLLPRSPFTTTRNHSLLPSWESLLSSSAAAASSSSSSSPSLSSSFPSSSSVRALRRRRVRSAGGLSSMLTEFMQMFQSFTEAELKSLIDRLIARKQRREAQQAGRRPKRAGGRGKTKKGQKLCALREAQLTVSELGLGYLSDETIPFHYCSGTCHSKRRLYDLIMKKWTGRGVSRRDRAPCCRPIKYENIVVFDINNKFQTLNNYSAQACDCV